MLHILEGAMEKSIAVEITGAYELNDEKYLEKLFEEKIASGHAKVNVLFKMDKLKLSSTSWKALLEDGIFAMKHFKYCGRIAIVGDSKFEEMLVKIDNMFFKNEKAGRAEKYFEVGDMDKAMAWVNE